MVDETIQSSATPDAPALSWVDGMPAFVRPYLRLMRADRPIGTWLLLIPCWWGLTLAALQTGGVTPWQFFSDAILFGIGAFVMRGAGCVYNDIVDRDFDAQVARTANRPLPAGHLKIWQAWALLLGLSLIGLVVLLQFNRPTIFTGLAALILVAAYPFMKRITWWPQAWLGLTFNWGALVSWTAISGSLAAPAILIYLGGIFWTLGYDTIYAHQDKDDDALIGVKSTALRFKQNTKTWLLIFYTGMIFFISLGGLVVQLGHWFYIGLAAPVLHLAWQIWRLDQDDSDICLGLFKSNRETGLMIVLAFLLGHF